MIIKKPLAKKSFFDIISACFSRWPVFALLAKAGRIPGFGAMDYFIPINVLNIDFLTKPLWITCE